MKKINEIEKEYEIFSHKTEGLKDKDSLFLYLDAEIDNVDEDIKAYNSELNENKRMQLSAKIRNLLFFIFAEENTSFYDEDNNIICQILNLMYTNRKYIERIQELITEENFQELLKLYEFIKTYYDSNYEYLDLCRRQLESKTEGFSFIDYSEEDNREVIDEFFYKKLSCITKKEHIEKKKKMC